MPRLSAIAEAVGLPGWGGAEVLGTLGVFVLVAVLSRRVDLLWARAPLWEAGVAVTSIGLLVRRVPAGVAALWLLGLSSYAWSLAPGDTLLTCLWGLLFVAAAAAGRWRGAFVVTVTLIVLAGLQDALTLNAFGLQSYLSGSVHYRLGQEALVLVPVALVGYGTTSRRWLAFAWWALATSATFASLISGSRGVYLPLFVVTSTAIVRLALDRRVRWRVLLASIALVAAVAIADRALPFHPVAEALTAKASVQAQTDSAAAVGGQRLRFWDEGLHVLLSRPLGVGAGGFRSTIHAFQRYPMLWSSSPHDVFVETAATTGWPGLVLLVLVLGSAFWRAWTTTAWPWALALVGIWFAFSVDVTADFPALMAVGFGTVGACFGADARDRVRSGGRAWIGRALRIAPSLLAAAVVTGAGVLALWWFVPCRGASCALTRYRGVEYAVVASLPSVQAASRPAFFDRLERLYPRSLWVLQLELRYARTPSERLVLARRIALAYPLQSWRNYLSWADMSVAAGDVSQAKRAVRAGLEVFGPGSQRYPEMRRDSAAYDAWLARAQAILAMPP